jgi:Na+-transporting methylmalonyl-CoA/oxaloacetate decarboxylase gamma subunit
MAALENIALMTFLMLVGAGVVFAVLAGLVYFLETMDD